MYRSCAGLPAVLARLSGALGALAPPSTGTPSQLIPILGLCPHILRALWVLEGGLWRRQADSGAPLPAGTQISCFSPSSFSWRQAAFVDAYCWASVGQVDTSQPLWLHKVRAGRSYWGGGGMAALSAPHPAGSRPWGAGHEDQVQ